MAEQKPMVVVNNGSGCGGCLMVAIGIFFVMIAMVVFITIIVN